MHLSNRLLHACRITLFTRANCSLCTLAKQTLSDVWDRRPFDYQEIDILQAEHQRWRDVYEFDTPVIHVTARPATQLPPERASAPYKLMHRFSVQQVMDRMDKAEQDQ
ncbi:hypothetical protein K3495_g1390 [Podosphaera aphanis]|nr:hypothetical protein K3495_g1390 [Podosphaera aphanis]